MRRYIFGAKQRRATSSTCSSPPACFKDALRLRQSPASASGEQVLFVGTKKQAQDVIAQQAERCRHALRGAALARRHADQLHARSRVDRWSACTRSRRASAPASSSASPKKEVIQLERELTASSAPSAASSDMPHLPGAVFIIDTVKEHIAVKEATKLGIKIVALVDTNCGSGGDIVPDPVQRRRPAVHRACSRRQDRRRVHRGQDAQQGALHSHRRHR
jgi:small subunit ribosomal protein S2